MKKIVFLTAVLFLIFAPTCAAQDETSYAAAEAYANSGEVEAFAEAYVSEDVFEANTNLDTPDEATETTETQPHEIYYQPESSQDQTYTKQTQPQTQSIASSAGQPNITDNTTTNTDEIAVKVDTISQLADDTIKQTDIIEKQNARTLNLFLLALGAIALILILTIANLITQRKIKNKLLQNA